MPAKQSNPAVAEIRRCQKVGEYLLFYIRYNDGSYRTLEFKSDDRNVIKAGDLLSNHKQYEVGHDAFWSRSLERTYKETRNYKERKRQPSFIKKVSNNES